MLKKHEMLTSPPPSHLGMHITFLRSCSSDLFKIRTQSVHCGYLCRPSGGHLLGTACFQPATPFSLTQCQGGCHPYRSDKQPNPNPQVVSRVASNKIDYIQLVRTFLNPEGYQNRITGTVYKL